MSEKSHKGNVKAWITQSRHPYKLDWRHSGPSGDNCNLPDIMPSDNDLYRIDGEYLENLNSIRRRLNLVELSPDNRTNSGQASGKTYQQNCGNNGVCTPPKKKIRMMKTTPGSSTAVEEIHKAPHIARKPHKKRKEGKPAKQNCPKDCIFSRRVKEKSTELRQPSPRVRFSPSSQGVSDISGSSCSTDSLISSSFMSSHSTSKYRGSTEKKAAVAPTTAITNKQDGNQLTSSLAVPRKTNISYSFPSIVRIAEQQTIKDFFTNLSAPSTKSHTQLKPSTGSVTNNDKTFRHIARDLLTSPTFFKKDLACDRTLADCDFDANTDLSCMYQVRRKQSTIIDYYNVPHCPDDARSNDVQKNKHFKITDWFRCCLGRGHNRN